MQLRRTQDQAMFIGCADADNASVICDLPATGIGDPNAGERVRTSAMARARPTQMTILFVFTSRS